MNQSSHIRLFKIILTYWPLLIASSIAAIIFVLFNSASIWITATMINNVLIDFSALDAENTRLLALESLSANEKLKLFSNDLLLKKTAIDFDISDKLSSFREEFIIPKNKIYLDYYLIYYSV